MQKIIFYASSFPFLCLAMMQVFEKKKFMINFLFIYLCYLFQHMLKNKIKHHTHTLSSPLLNNSHNLQSHISHMYNYHNSITIIKNKK
jgi:hypothetical protein